MPDGVVRAVASTCISASLVDPAMGHPLPLIEPWRLEARLSRRRGQLQVKVHTETVLAANVHARHLDRLMLVLGTWRDDAAETSQLGGGLRGSSHVVVNVCGQPLRVNHDVVIAPGEHAPVGVSLTPLTPRPLRHCLSTLGQPPTATRSLYLLRVSRLSRATTGWEWSRGWWRAGGGSHSVAGLKPRTTPRPQSCFGALRQTRGVAQPSWVRVKKCSRKLLLCQSVRRTQR